MKFEKSSTKSIKKFPHTPSNHHHQLSHLHISLLMKPSNEQSPSQFAPRDNTRASRYIYMRARTYIPHTQRTSQERRVRGGVIREPYTYIHRYVCLLGGLVIQRIGRGTSFMALCAYYPSVLQYSRGLRGRGKIVE